MALFKFPNLLPKEGKFAVLMENLAIEASACAHHLKTFVESKTEAEKAAATQAIRDSRTKAKILATDMTKELCLTFVTPFDREDIQDISTNLYKIPKTIEKVKQRMSMHGVALDKGDFIRQIDLIVLEAKAMEDMVRDLTRGQNSQQVQDKASLFFDLEHKGDAILNELLVSLFKNSNDAGDLIIRKDIYDMLEKIIDRYRDAAGIALQMVLKHT
ncbi:MAG: DUF47 family protein [Alphaproteobacteria bacterium]